MKRIIVFLVVSIVLCAVSVWAGAGCSSIANYSGKDNQCVCIHDSCSCCGHLEWFGINDTVCTNFSYLPNDYGISITITFNSYTIFNETVSARNPPPVCFGIPEMEKINADVCIRFYDLSFAQEHFHACGKVSISVYHIIHKSFDVGCFIIPKKELAEAYVTKSRELFVLIKEELEKLEYLKNNIPFVKML